MSELSNIEDVISTENGLFFSPFNSNNKEITLNELKSLLIS